MAKTATSTGFPGSAAPAPMKAAVAAPGTIGGAKKAARQFAQLETGKTYTFTDSTNSQNVISLTLARTLFGVCYFTDMQGHEFMAKVMGEDATFIVGDQKKHYTVKRDAFVAKGKPPASTAPMFSQAVYNAINTDCSDGKPRRGTITVGGIEYTIVMLPKKSSSKAKPAAPSFP